MRPVCVSCKRTMRPEKNGFCIVTMIPEPYQIWHGDKWKCPGCGVEIVTGFGRGPIAEVHQSDFADEIAYYKPLEITDS